MTLERRLARLELNRADTAHPEADAAFARLVAYLDSGGAETTATIRALAERNSNRSHGRRGG